MTLKSFAILLVLVAAGCSNTAPPHGARMGAASPEAPIAPTAAAPMPALLVSAWVGYKLHFIQADGRVVDPEGAQGSTSEGQSYAMLRAVWMDDGATFDSAWGWTLNNLGDPAHGRIGWHWGRASDGGWRLLSTDSAADADQDMALALLFAAHRWSPAYRIPAMALLATLWAEDVTTVAGHRYMSAANWAPGAAGGPVLNPSYFAPYAYRVFAAEDRSHPWSELVASSYQALEACTDAPLEGIAGRLPPNWCALNRDTGAAQAAQGFVRPNDYGYDAFRVMWRVALDAQWNHDPRAVEYLRSHSFLLEQWQHVDRLAAEYTHSGASRNAEDDPTVYAGAIGAFSVADPAAALAVAGKLKSTAATNASGDTLFGRPTNYYEQNWVWFGLALAWGALPDLAS